MIILDIVSSKLQSNYSQNDPEEQIILLTSAYIWIQNGWRNADATLGNFHKDVPDYSLNRRFRYSTRFHTFWYDYGYNLQTAKDILHITVPHYTRTNYKCYKRQILINYHTYSVNWLSDKSTCFTITRGSQRIRTPRVASSPITTSATQLLQISPSFRKRKIRIEAGRSTRPNFKNPHKRQ